MLKQKVLSNKLTNHNMENKDYQNNVGCCCMAMFIGFLAAVSFAFARVFWGAGILVVFIIFAAIMLYLVKEDYDLYKSFRRRIASKTVRDKLIYILEHPEGTNAYLRFGTPEEFKEFQEYIDNLKSSDDYFDDFYDFLELARKHKRLK